MTFSLTLRKETKVWGGTWCPTQAWDCKQGLSPWRTAYPRDEVPVLNVQSVPNVQIPQNDLHLWWHFNFSIFLHTSNTKMLPPKALPGDSPQHSSHTRDIANTEQPCRECAGMCWVYGCFRNMNQFNENAHAIVHFSSVILRRERKYFQKLESSIYSD